MLEVFRYALNRQGFLIKGFIPDLMAPPGNPFLIPPRRINLPDPSGISVAGCPYQDVLGGSRNRKFFELVSEDLGLVINYRQNCKRMSPFSPFRKDFCTGAAPKISGSSLGPNPATVPKA